MPHALLAIALHLTRLGTWSVGIGVGAVETPLPASVRAGRGDAFVQARDAVERAKRAATRLAVTGDEAATDAESLVRLLVELRDRRTAEGWEVYDLLADGLSQRDAAERLGDHRGCREPAGEGRRPARRGGRRAGSRTGARPRRRRPLSTSAARARLTAW